MPTTYKDLELSSAERRILRNVLKHKIHRSKQRNPKYEFLFYYSLVTNIPGDPEHYSISYKGRFYLRYYRKDKFRFWFPVAISLVALAFSAVSLAIDVLQIILCI